MQPDKTSYSNEIGNEKNQIINYVGMSLNKKAQNNLELTCQSDLTDI